MTIAFFIALGCYIASAVCAGFRRTTADVLGAVLSVIGSIAGIRLALESLITNATIPLLSTNWQVPGGSVVLASDSLSGAFLIVIFTVAALGNIHGLAYWKRSDHPDTASKLRVFFALMTIGLALVMTARNSVFFLLAWELMALSAFFLVSTDDASEEVRRAAWIYLVATHIGTVSLFAAFGLLRLQTGSFAITAGLAPSARLSLVFLLALFGFGIKAGLVPLHFWLPGAHANAPSHVSALMSGVMLKAGIYGILRMTSLVTVPPAWWSYLLASIAAITSVTGIALALGQTEIKRALAYSSIENMGIVCLGIALALAGRTTNQPLLIALGLGGAIAHVWSHSAFKSLLFFASGGVLHAAHTRSMDRMGGLLKRMPITGLAFIIGAIAASGLPPLNGFISEWLIALGFFHAIRSGSMTGWFLAFSAPFLALAGAIALASFFRITATVMLGTPRTREAAEAVESSWPMLAPLVLLAVVCFVLGILPMILSRPLESVIACWSGISNADLNAFLTLPFRALSVVALLLIGGAILLVAITRKRASVTWDCGYAEPTARMQYTSSSAGQWFSEYLLPSALRPKRKASQIRALFPETAAFASSAPDPFSSRLYEPFAVRWKNRFERLRWLQQGRLTIYLIYILITTIGGIAWAALRGYLK